MQLNFISIVRLLLSQACTFSAKCKNKNTVKVLVGITPSGVISLVSKCYEGSIPDRKLVEFSVLLEKLEPGDEIMADKGFQIQDLLAPLGVQLNVPPFLGGNAQMEASNVKKLLIFTCTRGKSNWACQGISQHITSYYVGFYK